MTDPTPQDIANAEARTAIAARFQAEYDQCSSWADELFGPGYLPRCRHYLLDKTEEDDARRTGRKPVASATVYTVLHEETGEAQHFMLREGKPVEVASYAEGFGEMLNEPHPTERISVRGEMVPPHRYSLCWASIETYRPRSAESLAKARQARQDKAVDREAEASPLFSHQIRADGFVKKSRSR